MNRMFKPNLCAELRSRLLARTIKGIPRAVAERNTIFRILAEIPDVVARLLERNEKHSEFFSI